MKTAFEWDEIKAASNLRKHGVTFEEAEAVFFDPHALFKQDRIVDGEARWKAIGATEDWVILAVAHVTYEEGNYEVIRIISARPVDHQEKSEYENADG
jgi:uncharacterized DUF497 family protein